MLRQIRKFPKELKHKQPLAKDLSGFFVIESNVHEDHNVTYISGEYTEPTLIMGKNKHVFLYVLLIIVLILLLARYYLW